MNKIAKALTDNSCWDCHWQMSVAERCILQVVLGRLKPRMSVEIGSYQGGSLQVISEFSEQVIAVDVEKSVETSLAGKFTNVEFRIGNSTSVVPALVADLNKSGQLVDFVLIDGDHSAEGVKRDIQAVLGLRVQSRMVILMHDSFNPDCRRGMLQAEWEKNPHVRYVEVDFSAGNFHSPPVDTAQPRSMWGGFACAVLEPGERSGSLKIEERQRSKFQAVEAVSVHAAPARKSRLRSFAGKISAGF
jgi:hypothetical protein